MSSALTLVIFTSRTRLIPSGRRSLEMCSANEQLDITCTTVLLPTVTGSIFSLYVVHYVFRLQTYFTEVVVVRHESHLKHRLVGCQFLEAFVSDLSICFRCCVSTALFHNFPSFFSLPPSICHVSFTISLKSEPNRPSQHPAD